MKRVIKADGPDGPMYLTIEPVLDEDDRCRHPFGITVAWTPFREEAARFTSFVAHDLKRRMLEDGCESARVVRWGR